MTVDICVYIFSSRPIDRQIRAYKVSYNLTWGEKKKVSKVQKHPKKILFFPSLPPPVFSCYSFSPYQLQADLQPKVPLLYAPSRPYSSTNHGSSFGCGFLSSFTSTPSSFGSSPLSFPHPSFR